MVSLLPLESLKFIELALGEEYSELLMQEVSALVLAHAEGEVTNVKLRKVVHLESSEATTLLRSLVERDLLEGHGSNRNRIYTLGNYFKESILLGENTPKKPSEDTPGVESTSKTSSEDTPRMSLGRTLSPETRKRLKRLQYKIKQNTIQPVEISEFILLTCQEQRKSSYEIAEELSLTRRYVARRH